MHAIKSTGRSTSQATGKRRAVIFAATTAMLLVLSGCYYAHTDAYYGGGRGYGPGPGYGYSGHGYHGGGWGRGHGGYWGGGRSRW